MKRPIRGFTLFELLVVVTVLGAVVALGLPQMRQTLVRESVRSARRAVTTQMARARGIASSRGCRSVLHITPGDDARLWITACNLAGTGIDTVGAMERLSVRFGVSVTSTTNAMQFAPNGLAMAAGWNRMGFTKGGNTDTLSISPLGKAFW